MEPITIHAALALCCLVLAALAAFSFLTRSWRMRKYGCSRCTYRKSVYTRGFLHKMCTASCGNQRGQVCPAWRYKDPNEEDES